MTSPPPIQLFRPVICEEAIAAVGEVLRSGWIGLGPRTEEFERAFAAYVGARHAIAVNSATAALHLAAIVAGIAPGDEVLTTSLTFVSSNHVLRYLDAVPAFVDVDPRTLNLDLELAEAALTPRSRAIMAVHYGGNPLDIDRLYAFADRHRLRVIEDAAHACGAGWRSRRIGSFGLTCFSFHAVKNLAIGDGGMITTDDDAEAQRLLRLRWMGIDKSTFKRSGPTYQWEYEVAEVGYKYHMNDIAAAIGIAQLKRVDEGNARRRAVVARYRAELSGLGERLRFVEPTPGAEPAHHLCAIMVPRRDRVADALKRRGVNVGVHYKPNHLYPPYERFAKPLPVTERAYASLISLPLHLGLSDADVGRVIVALREALDEA